MKLCVSVNDNDTCANNTAPPPHMFALQATEGFHTLLFAHVPGFKSDFRCHDDYVLTCSCISAPQAKLDAISLPFELVADEGALLLQRCTDDAHSNCCCYRKR